MIDLKHLTINLKKYFFFFIFTTFLFLLFTTTAQNTLAADDIIGNEILDVADSTLTRAGIGTTNSPYSVKLNLGNSNTWTAGQTFNADTLFFSKVGIGSTNPSGIFHIVNSSENTTGPIVDIPATGIAGTAESSARNLTIKASGQSVLNFGAYPASVYTPGIMLQGADNSRFIWLSAITGGTNARVRVAATGIDFYVGGTTTKTDAGTLGLTITSSADIGIGTSSPGQKFDIVGGNGRVQSGYNWLTNSDAKFKKNVTTLNNTLNSILNLRGVRYDLVDDKNITPGKGKQVGFIAQELETQYPELVITEKDGTKSVAYDKITAVLLQAIKEQQQQIEQLRKEVEYLKSKDP